MFPASMGRGLVQLRHLKVRKCPNLEVIIAKEKDEASPPSFQFPELTDLQLLSLDELKSLYGGPHTLECLKLKSLEVTGCFNIFCDKFISNLEELTIDERGFDAINQSGAAELCSKLKKVTLHSLESERSIGIVFGFLRGLRSLETFVFKDSSSEWILGLDDALHQRPFGEERRHLLRIKHLELYVVKELKHITTGKDSQLNLIVQHLQTLKISYCHYLINIAPSSASLENLTILHVDFCYEVTNLVTASTAKSMVQLMELKVVNCRMIEEIVATDGDGPSHDVIIFNKLKLLELCDLRKLGSFCSDKTCNFDFPLLEKVTVKGCDRMNIFCGGVLSTPKLQGILFEDEQQWEGNLNATLASRLREWVGELVGEGMTVYQNVESLELANNKFSSKALLASQIKSLHKLRVIVVRDCDSVQVVFDLEEGYAGARMLPRVNEMKLSNLPMLTQICNKAPSGILDFTKLEVVKIENCRILKHAFTWPMASCLSQLQLVEVENCEMMESLIGNGEEEEDVAHVTFGSLKNVYITRCPSIQALISAPIHFTHLVFPKLQTLSIDIESFTGMMKHELRRCSATTKSQVSLVDFLSRLPTLVELRVHDSDIRNPLLVFGVLDSNSEEASTMTRAIKSLKLFNLDDLEKIWWLKSQFHASLFQSLEACEVRCCGNLTNLASFSTCFQNLATLEVYKCNQLVNLITSSMAKGMAQLEKLSVESCEMLMEVVGDGSDETTGEIVFAKMKTLELVDLQSLKGFSLRSCNFTFPCLEVVAILRCPNLRIFCHGTINTPMLNCVKQYGSREDGYWEDDLNTTINHLYLKMVAFEYISDIKLSEFPLLKERWEGQFDASLLSSLERLEVDDCELFSNAIPLHLLRHLNWLKVLIVEKCDSMEQVIDLEGIKADERGTNQLKTLKELQLIDLPRLKQVWSKDPHQILSFKNLQLLKVHNCGNLTYIFNLSMALSLQNLQHVDVINCSLVEHIVMKDEEETMQEYQTIFPSLQSMNLCYLTKLLSFCSTSGIIECSSLKKIEVIGCPNMNLFASTFLKRRDSCIIVEEKGEAVGVEDPNSVSAFLGNKIVIPGLEELKLEWDNLKDELNGYYRSGFLSKLKYIELTSFQGKNAVLPSTLRFPKLEKLALSDALIEEINFDELRILKDKDPKSVALLTNLKLSKLPKLKHVVHHDCQSVPLFQNLEDLAVLECSYLKILVPSSVSFQNLTNLEVSKCDGLINLITASTARSLVQLRRMNVKDCKTMQEIVGITLDGEEYEIWFSQLEYLGLDDLPCLTSFCSGKYDFHFPSLQEVMVTGCPNMNNFSKQVSVTPKLREVKTGSKQYDWEWRGSLDNTIQALFAEQVYTLS